MSKLSFRKSWIIFWWKNFPSENLGCFGETTFLQKILDDILSKVNLTKPEKRKVERKAKTHFECPQARPDEEVIIWHLILNIIIISTVRCSILHPTQRSNHPSTCSTTVLHPSWTCYSWKPHYTPFTMYILITQCSHRIHCRTRWALQKWVQT